MNVALISPVRRAGTTTVSLMLSLALSERENKRICWVSTGKDSYSLKTYMGITENKDNTMCARHIVRLLEMEAMKPNDIPDYCKKVNDNLNVLNTTAGNISKSDSSKLVEFIMDSSVHDINIVDVDTEIYEDSTQKIIEKSDLVIVVLTQETACIDMYRNWIEHECSKVLRDKNPIFIINKYNPVVSAIRDFTKSNKLKHSRCCKLSYSPFIIKDSNAGNLHTLMPYIYEMDYRVSELKNEMKECCMLVNAQLGLSSTWR